VLGEVRKVIRT